MLHRPHRTWERPFRTWWTFLAFSLLLVLLLGYGCRRNAHTSDPKLRQIDEMLEAQLSKGTPRPRVEFFLNARGYKIENAPESNDIVTTIRHIDTDTLQPVTARVTFHFDAQGKLTTYDLQAAPNAPLPP